jgi:hypothetical protein
MNRKSSIIDYPRKELDKSIWDISDETLKLQPEIQDEIDDIISSFLDDLDLPEEAVIDIFIYGSILTNQYNSKTDVDARILLDPEVVQDKYPGITGDDLYDLTMNIVHDIPLGKTRHPFNATVVIQGEDTKLGQSPLGISNRDAVYSVKEGKIIHEGIGYDESFDPDKEFVKERDDATGIMTKLDALVQDAKTKAIDIETLKDAVGEVANPDQLIEKIEERLNGLNTTIKQMVDEYNKIKEERSESYKKGPLDNRHKAPGNIVEKILEKYQYVGMLKKLKRLFKEGIDPSEVEDVENALKFAKRNIRIKAVNINKEDLLTLWYENEKGDKFIPNLTGAWEEPPEGYVYQFSQFPNELTLNMLYLIEPNKVAKCAHPAHAIRETHGWVDGIEGRECGLCNGTQERKRGEPWPEKWDAYGSRSVGEGHSSWSEDLVLAMANSGDFSLSESILIAANACERCMNALAHEYGLDWGYPEFGPEWKKSATECDFCKNEKKKAAFPYEQPGPPKEVQAPPTMQTGPAAPTSIDVGRIDEGGMLNQVQGSTCPHCGHVNPLTATESDELTCQNCGKKFTAKDGFSLGTGVSMPSQTNPYPYESDFPLYGQLTPQLQDDMVNILKDTGISPEDLEVFRKKLKGEPIVKQQENPQTNQTPNNEKEQVPESNTGVHNVLKPGIQMNKLSRKEFKLLQTGHLLYGVLLMNNLIKKLADSTGGTGGVFGEPPGKNPGDDPYSSGGGALAEYGKEGEPEDKKKKKELDDASIWEIVTVLDGIDILPFLNDEELMEELLAAFPMLGEASDKIDRIIALYPEPPEGTGQYQAPTNPDYDTVPQPKRRRQIGPVQDGMGKGKGRPGGLRRYKNKDTCPAGGPGKGLGEGLGKGKFRKNPIEETGEAVGIDWADSYPPAYKQANDDIKALISQWLEENPDPSDDEVHALAEEIGMETDELEEILYELATEHAEEGDDREAPVGDNEDELTEEMAMAIGEEIGIDWESSPFDPAQFLIGIKVELEHGSRDPETNITDDDLVETAKIALAHLKEIDDYYDRLTQMEDEAKRQTEDSDKEDTNKEESEKPSGGTVGGFNEGFPARTAAAYMTLCPTCKTIQKAPIEGEGVKCPFCGRGWLDSLEHSDPEKYAEYQAQSEDDVKRLHERTRQQRGAARVGARLDNKIRQTINRELQEAGMDGNGRFETAGSAFAQVTDILNAYNLKPVSDMSSALSDSDILIEEFQNKGRETIDIETLDGELLDNTMLVFSYYQFLETGKYEILAMLS